MFPEMQYVPQADAIDDDSDIVYVTDYDELTGKYTFRYKGIVKEYTQDDVTVTETEYPERSLAEYEFMGETLVITAFEVSTKGPFWVQAKLANWIRDLLFDIVDAEWEEQTEEEVPALGDGTDQGPGDGPSEESVP